MLEEPNELSSDLEWMLESGQADREMLLDALLQEHYIPVYRLSLAMLGEMVAAHQAAMQTIGLALMDYPPRRGRLQLKPWLYGHAMRSINRLISGKPRVEPATPSSASIEFCEVFATYGLKERYALTFRYLLDWEAEDIAALLRVNEHAVQVQLDLSRGRLFEALKGEIGTAPAPLAGLSDEQIRANEGAYQDSHLAETFRSCWPAPDLSETDWQRIRTQVEDFPALKLPFWQHFPGWREPVLILMTILIIISLGLGLGIILGERILPEFSIFSPDRTPSIQPIGMVERQFPPEGEAQAYLYRVLAGDDLASVSLALDLPQESLLELNEIYSDTQLVPGQGLVVVPYAVYNPPPTVVPPAPRGKQLNMRDSSSTITQVIHSSAGYWNTLWIDAQSVDYGPVGYIGAPRIYRAQAWVDQPAQSLELFGLLGEDPSSLQLISDGKQYLMSPDSELPTLSVWDETTEPILGNDRLRQMVYPQTGIWGTQQGRFESVDQDEIAGRDTIVIDWFNSSGHRQARLWLDVVTGVALRVQEYGGPDFQTLIADTVTTSILYNLEIPQNTLFDPHTLASQGYATLSDEEASGAEAGSATLVVPLSRRPTLPPDPLPPGFSAGGSWLHFQFDPPVGMNYALGSVAGFPATLFTDGYTLGQVNFPPPWGLQCTRSPDGLRLAFNTSSDGVQPADTTLRWLNLKDAQEIYEPLPGFQAEYFAFSPDSRSLAVSGYDPQDSFRGIKIVDIGTGENHTLIQLPKADSLVWSPDGAYLALVGQKQDSEGNYIMIIQARLGEVIFERPVELSGSRQEFSWSSMAWGLEFPHLMGDMGDCARPP